MKLCDVRPHEAISFLLSRLALLFIGMASLAPLQACPADAIGSTADAAYAIAVLRDDLPEFNSRRAESVSSLLRGSGHQVHFITADELADKKAFNEKRYNLLVLTNSSVFPASAIKNLDHYLRQGGDIALLGGKSFDRLVIRQEGKWKDFEAMRFDFAAGRDLDPMSLFTKIDIKEWKRYAQNSKAQSKIKESRFRQDPAIRMELRSVKHYDMFSAGLREPIPAEHNVLALWARATSPGTKQASLEIKTTSGGRWVTAIDVEGVWRPTVLRASDFTCLEAGSEQGVDSLRFSDASQISLGLSKNFGEFTGPDHTLMFAGLGTAESDLARGHTLTNLDLYNDFASFQYQAAQVSSSTRDANDWLNKPLVFRGPLEGTSAFTIPRSSISQAYPILTTNNANGQQITAASLIAHYGGPYQNSQWFIVGCNSDGFYRQASWDDLLVQVVSRMRQETWLRDAQEHNLFSDKQRMRHAIGVTHAGAKYHFTERDVLNEGAAVIEELGTRTIKLWIPRPEDMYRFNHDWPKNLTSMTAVLKTEAWQEVLNRPFDTYYLEAFAMPRRRNVLANGISDEERAWITHQFDEVTRHLLTTYRGTGKTFVLQNWEGDWALRGATRADRDPKPERIQTMIDWLNARQDGVERARKAVGEHGVRVLHAAETNLVLQQMRDNRPGVVRDVLPHTRVDLASYSCYDTRGDAKAFRAALEYIAMHLPDTTRNDLGNRVVIGEIGVPENVMGQDAVKRMLPEQIEIATAYGCPHLLYWGLYCNELRGAPPLPVKQNDQVNGFWLIKPDGSRAWAWSYLSTLLQADQK